MQPFAWQCPFCGHHATITNKNLTSLSGTFDSNKYLTQLVKWQAISCPNPQCREYTFTVQISDTTRGLEAVTGQVSPTTQRYFWELIPAAPMKILPSYVPDPIVADYKEACLIADLSPKASATLSRRCLQGMIRDFWGVSRKRLVDEIDAIKDKIDDLAWNAINSLRKLGNIGAHMEKDINVIVDVDPDEAKLLIQLIETLVEDWYVTRHERTSRMEKLVETANSKFQKIELPGV